MGENEELTDREKIFSDLAKCPECGESGLGWQPSANAYVCRLERHGKKGSVIF